MSKWNVELETHNFTVSDITLIQEFYSGVSGLHKHKRRDAALKTIPTELRNKISKVYSDGYGLKLIARELRLSYTNMRTIFSYFDIEINRGHNIVTEVSKRFRSERVKGDKNPWFDWTHTRPSMMKTNSRGIQGYYKKSSGVLIWLRSTWEYVYAKWLDSNGIKYEYEKRNYILDNGQSYRPDFSLLDELGNVTKIVEIKGYYKDRVYKIELFKSKYSTIDIEMIDDISPYCENGSYDKELKRWKADRLKK